MNVRHIAVVIGFVFSSACTTTRAQGPWPDLPGGGAAFETFFVTWTDNGAPEMFDYLRRAKPEVVQVGFYGPMFHGYAHHKDSTGYPMQLPVSGEREALARQTEINRQIHETLPGTKVVGHFQLCNVVENPGAPFAFIKWYDEMWDASLLGEKPVADVRELLQRDAQGNVIKGGGYIDFIGLCLSSPHTRTMLKRMVKVAVNAGADGLVSNYNYRWGCVCHWCQDEFRAYLHERYDAAALREKFGIAPEDLNTHVFPEIPAKIPGYPKADEATELHWAAMDWGNRQFKAAFDEIYVEYGRSLKPGFIVGTWNHLGLVGHTEERALMPIDLWGVGEDYFWYSGSHGPPKLADRKCGDAWLNLLWLREMAQSKPFMIGKYEGLQVRASFAEASATGGAGTGLYHPFMDPVGAQVMARHLNFIHDHAALYRDAKPYAEVGLLLPRQSVMNRKPEALDAFRTAGVALAEAQALFDVVLDERLSDERLRDYRVLVLPPILSLTDTQRAMIDRYAAAGGQTITLDAEATSADALMQSLTTDPSLSDIAAPWTLRAAAFDQSPPVPPGGVAPAVRTLHLVNYNRDEASGAAEGKTGPAAELPLPERNIAVRLALPPNAQVQSVTLLSPDANEPTALTHETRNGQLHFTVPEVVVYSVVDVRWR